MYEKATRFGRSGITVPRMISPEQKTRKFLRDYRLRRLDELIQRHKADPDYDSATSAWRREKIDLLAQEYLPNQRKG